MYGTPSTDSTSEHVREDGPRRSDGLGRGDPARAVFPVNEPRPPRVNAAGALSRGASRMRAVSSAPELRDAVAEMVEAVFVTSARSELFLAGPNGLEPTFHTSREGRVASLQLFAGLRARMRSARESLAEPRAFSASETADRRALIVAPVLAPSGELLGALLVQGTLDIEEFSPMELVALEGIAVLAASALSGFSDRDAWVRARAETDRAAACRLQRGFMSAALPPGIGLTAFAEYLPAFDVGGDFYGVRYLEDGTVSAAIGDVSGNGVSAALLMSRVTSDIERAVVAGERPATILAGVNQRLSQSDTEMFVTASCLRIDVATRRLTTANAGHLPAVLRRGDGEVFTFGGASGMPLGMMPVGEYIEEDLPLERGDIVLLATDGLLEALDHPTGHRGMEYLLTIVESAPRSAEALSRRIRAAVAEARRAHVLDDVTWVALQVTA